VLNNVKKFAEVLADEIAGMGISHVFGLPGGQAMHLMDAVDQHPKLTYVTALHEQAASFMAIGYARQNASPAACLVTTGPGGTNAITGLAGAWLDSIPILFLSGQFRTDTLKMSSGVRQIVLQQMFPIDLVKPMTKFAKLLDDPNDLNEVLENAMMLMTSGRPGPVWLDIPLDIQASLVTARKREEMVVSKSTPNLTALHDLLQKAKRPVILAGHGVRIANAVDTLRKVVSKHKIPLLTSINGMDLIEDSFEYFYGRPNYWGQREANFIIQNSDLVIAIGAGLHLETTGFDAHLFAREAKVVVVDIDPLETAKKSIRVDLAYNCDARLFLTDFIGMQLENTWNDWLMYCNSARSHFKFNQFPRSSELNGLSMYDAVEKISELAPEEATIVYGNAGGHFTTAVQCFRVKFGQRLMSSIGIGAMGASIPMAIGASFASPERPIIAFTGDGGIQFNIQELSTIVGHKLPIHLFVFENQGYASLRSTQRRYFNGRLIASSPDSQLYLPDLMKVISSFGFPVNQVSTLEELEGAIKKNLCSRQFATIIHVDPENPIQPRLGSTMKDGGQMVSDPLEDLSPHLDDEEFQKWMIVPGLRETE
jgi:acetolactate synthase-1/2/3 large subunit